MSDDPSPEVPPRHVFARLVMTCLWFLPALVAYILNTRPPRRGKRRKSIYDN